MARTRSRGGRRPDYQWAGINVFAANDVSNVHKFAGSSNLGVNIAGTLMRVRGDIQVLLDVGAADDSMSCAAGLIVANDDAVAIGPTAFPSPSDDLDADWVWHGFFSMRSLSATQGTTEGAQVRSREIDTKAMRRFKPIDNLAMIVDGVVQSGSPTADFIGAFRVLLAS